MVVIFIFDFTKLFHRKKGFIMTASFVKLFGVDAAGSDTVAVHLLTSNAVFCMSVNTISKTHQCLQIVEHRQGRFCPKSCQNLGNGKYVYKSCQPSADILASRSL